MSDVKERSNKGQKLNVKEMSNVEVRCYFPDFRLYDFRLYDFRHWTF